jgi:two-component sensor histidine kinase
VAESTLSLVRHRVVNDFSLVHALLGMAMRKTKDADAERLFRATRGRVRVIALLHSVAWRPEAGGPSAEDLSAYLNEIVREVERARGTHHRIRVDVETHGVALSLSEMAAVGLCVSELVQNALDHAFPSERQGSVHATLARCDGGDDLMLRVVDDGVGMQPERADASNGLGLSLVRLLAEQLSGKLTFASNQSQGTDFCLRFASTEESRSWQTS